MLIVDQSCGDNVCCWVTVSPCNGYHHMLVYKVVNQQMKEQSGGRCKRLKKC